MDIQKLLLRDISFRVGVARIIIPGQLSGRLLNEYQIDGVRMESLNNVYQAEIPQEAPS
jgi:hypothetical protein